jgi:flagellar motor switch protein FliN
MTADAATGQTALDGEVYELESPEGTADLGDSADTAPTVRPVLFGQLPASDDSALPGDLDLPLDVGVKITVELGRTARSAYEIAEIQPGAVVELDRLAGETVDILVNGRVIARGEVVVVDEARFGVRVVDVVSPARRVQSLR